MKDWKLSHFIFDFIGAFIAFILWDNEYISLWGVIAVLVTTALISTILSYDRENS